MRNLILIAVVAAAVTGCTDVRENQRADCERQGGRYFASSGADDDVCVFTDPNVRVRFHEDDEE